jgi:hypothetical protein
MRLRISFGAFNFILEHQYDDKSPQYFFELIFAAGLQAIISS